MTALASRTTDEDHAVGAWEAAFVGWRVFAPVVVVNAAVQAATVLGDPVPGVDAGFLGLLLGSVVAVLLAVWVTVVAAVAIVAGRAREGWRPAVRRPVVLVWALGVGIVAVVASLLATWLLPVVLALGAFLLPPAAAGTNPVVGALRTIRRAPLRCVLLVVVALAVAALGAVVALLLGLFLTGALSAALLWLWLGATSTVLLCRYEVLARRARLRA